MHLDLSDEEAAALIKELADFTGNHRYRFSGRVRRERRLPGDGIEKLALV
jgi:hypothetical protein